VPADYSAHGAKDLSAKVLESFPASSPAKERYGSSPGELAKGVFLAQKE
jgi:hypothetical protein